MIKSTLSRALFVAGAVALAGAAHAQNTFDSPTRAGEASTMTQGQPNLETQTGANTSVLGAGPAIVTTETWVTTSPVYVSPVYVMPPVASAPHELDRGGASDTSTVPGRAGEASTMTGGVPNMSTDNLPGHVYGPR